MQGMPVELGDLFQMDLEKAYKIYLDAKALYPNKLNKKENDQIQNGIDIRLNIESMLKARAITDKKASPSKPPKMFAYQSGRYGYIDFYKFFREEMKRTALIKAELTKLNEEENCFQGSKQKPDNDTPEVPIEYTKNPKPRTPHKNSKRNKRKQLGNGKRPLPRILQNRRNNTLPKNNKLQRQRKNTVKKK